MRQVSSAFNSGRVGPVTDVAELDLGRHTGLFPQFRECRSDALGIVRTAFPTALEAAGLTETVGHEIAEADRSANQDLTLITAGT